MEQGLGPDGRGAVTQEAADPGDTAVRAIYVTFTAVYITFSPFCASAIISVTVQLHLLQIYFFFRINCFKSRSLK